MLIIGSCGDGKTTLMNALRDPEIEEGKTGKKARGVTKQIGIYPANHDLFQSDVALLDTPGVGDKDIKPMELVAQLEALLTSGNFPEGIDGVVATAQIRSGRVDIGAQIVQQLVEKGFVTGGDKAAKWSNVILAGTMKDRADEDEIECFESEVVGEFFENAPNQTGTNVMVSKTEGYDQVCTI